MAETEARLSMLGAGCTSCAYAIERNGRKLPEVRDIHVDIARSEIRVKFDESVPGVPDKIIDLVNRIGHDAVRTDGDCAGACERCRDGKGHDST